MASLKPLGGDALDALNAHVAVLDETGRVIAVNRRWRRFGSGNGATSDYVGVNYLDVCAMAAKAGEQKAGRAEHGMRRLLNGEAHTFGLAYNCGLRTFRLRATRVENDPVRVLVIHEDITALLSARRERDRAHAGLSEVRSKHAARAGEAYEELGQRLAAISLAALTIERASPTSTALTTIRAAVREARQELRILRYQAEQEAPGRRPRRANPPPR